MEAAHTYPASEIFKRFGVSQDRGLSSERVQEAQKKFGPNGKRRFVESSATQFLIGKVCCDDIS